MAGPAPAAELLEIDIVPRSAPPGDPGDTHGQLNCCSPARRCSHVLEVCVLGLGYVGLTFSAFAARQGLAVHGVERQSAIRERARNGVAHFHEPGLDEVLRELVEAGRFEIHAVIPNRHSGRARIYVITVGTPLIESGGSIDSGAIESVWSTVMADALPGDLAILRSTVRVGTTRALASEMTRLQIPVAFCPERTIEGDALNELATLPQIVGGMDANAACQAIAFFERLGVETVPVDSPEEAEIAKLVSNTERDLRFAFANEVAMLCDAWGAGFRRVRHAVRHRYPRSDLATAGPAAGPCLEKDGWILAESGRVRDFETRLAVTARRQNEHLVDHVATRVARYAEALPDGGAGAPLGIAGLAFKGRPATDDVRGSLAPAMARALRHRLGAVTVLGFDPHVDAEQARDVGFEPVGSMEELVARCAVVIVQTNHACWEELVWDRLLDVVDGPMLVLDLWGLVPAEPFAGRERVILERLGG